MIQYLPHKIRMKNRLTVFSIMTAFAVPLVVYAASAAFSLSPSSGTLTVGTTRAVEIYVDPAGSPIYTVKAAVNFPASQLHVESFTPASGTIALSQPGYDLVDNAGGQLIKTVGFPKGVSDRTLVGTVVFSVAQAGDAAVSVTSSSIALAADNSNVASSFGSAHFTLVAPAGGGSAPVGDTETSGAGETSGGTSGIGGGKAPAGGTKAGGEEVTEATGVEGEHAPSKAAAAGRAIFASLAAAAALAVSMPLWVYGAYGHVVICIPLLIIVFLLGFFTGIKSVRIDKEKK